MDGDEMMEEMLRNRPFIGYLLSAIHPSNVTLLVKYCLDSIIIHPLLCIARKLTGRHHWTFAVPCGRLSESAELAHRDPAKVT